MSNYKNPYVKLNRLSNSVFQSFLTLSDSSVKEQPEEINKKPPKFVNTEKTNEKRPKFAKPKEKYKKGSRLAKLDRKTGRLSRSAKGTSDLNCSDRDSIYSKDSDRDSFYSKDSDRDSIYSKDSDSEFRPNNELKGRKRKTTSKDTKLTEYEKLVLKNKNDKMAFLKSLKINEVKEDFSDAVKSFSRAVRPKTIPKPKPHIVPRLKIARSSKVRIDLSEKAIDARAKSEARKAFEESNGILPESLHLEDVLRSDQSYESFVDNFADLDQECTEPIDNYEFRFNDMELLLSHIKTFPKGITALDIHPMQEKTIIAGGSQNGSIHLWNMTDSEPYEFELHSKGISLLKFCPENPHLIMCCSNNGLLRKGDLVSNVYNKVTDDENCTYFDFLSPDTYLVGHQDGYVSVVDIRASRTKYQYAETSHLCHDYCNYIRSVSVHPLNKNEFITPTNKGCVRLWDLRKLNEHPVIEVCHSKNKKALNSAIYSPLTGKSVLTSSTDGQICRSDIARWTELPLKIFKRKLPVRSPIYATWQPKTDSVFAVGSKLNPRSIDIYNRCNKSFNYSHECIRGAIYICAFHPSLPIIAAKGVSQVYPFADKNLQMAQCV